MASVLLVQLFDLTTGESDVVTRTLDHNDTMTQARLLYTPLLPHREKIVRPSIRLENIVTAIYSLCHHLGVSVTLTAVAVTQQHPNPRQTT